MMTRKCNICGVLFYNENEDVELCRKCYHEQIHGTWVTISVDDFCSMQDLARRIKGLVGPNGMDHKYVDDCVRIADAILKN